MIRNFLASIFSIVFIVFFVIFNLFFSIEKTFFNDETYLSDEFVTLAYDDFSYKAYDLFTETGKYSKFFSKNEFLVLLKNSFSLSEFKIEIENILKLINTFPVDQETGSVNISIPFNFLINYKEIINNTFANATFDLIPKCTNSDVEGGACVPELFTYEMFKSEFDKELEKVFYNQLPEDFNVLWYVGSNFADNVSDAFSKVKNYLFSLILLILLISLSLIVIVLWGDLFRVLKWVSFVLFFSCLGSIVLIYLLFSGEFLNAIFSSVFSSVGSFQLYYDYFMGILLSSVSIYLIFFSFIFLLGFILSFVLNKRKDYV